MPTASTSFPVVADRPPRWLRLLLGATSFLGAFLLFVVQPLLAKAVLPWFGGTAAVWTTALLFFQCGLVAGYAAVVGLERAPPRVRTILYAVLLGSAAATLGILPDDSWRPAPGTMPIARLLLMLAACAGLPYFVLATTSPLVQTWFARLAPGESPYRLYAVSNAGSLAGLLAYPLVIEPQLELSLQERAWSIGFAIFAAAALTCAFVAWRRRDPAAENVATSSDATAGSSGGALNAALNTAGRAGSGTPSPDDSVYLAPWLWLALAAGGSSLLMVITNRLCRDVASVPLLWVVPMAIYLITFIWVFEFPRFYRRLPFAILCLASIPRPMQPADSFELTAAQCLLALFGGCMLWHGELAARKPPARRLTSYYLMLSLGGAVGGLLIGVAAPLLFLHDWEFILVVGATFAFAAVIVGRASFDRFEFGRRFGRLIAAALVLGSAAIVVVPYAWHLKDHELDGERNFYGSVFILGTKEPTTGKLKFAVMQNGSTFHGSQAFVPGVPPIAESYYAPQTGIGMLLMRTQEYRRVGVVGLGAGTLAAYGRHGDVYRFYELNPAVARFAGKYFSYLGESSAECQVVVGDGRVMLEAEPDQKFDILVLDAFSSDAIPTHLLTLEACETWFRHIRQDGYLAIHITNRHLDLTPLVVAVAKRMGLRGEVIDNDEIADSAVKRSRWVILSRRAYPELRSRFAGTTVERLSADSPIRPWTDEFSSLMSVMK